MKVSVQICSFCTIEACAFVKRKIEVFYYWKTKRLVSNPADANIFNSMGSLSHRVSYWLWGKVKMFMIFKVIFGYSNLRRCEENVLVLFLSIFRSIFRPFLLIFVVWLYGSQRMFFFLYIQIYLNIIYYSSEL